MSDGPFPSTIHALLKQSKFLHLATCSNDNPHVSLMNYTFIEPSDIQDKKFHHLILVSTPKETTKFRNLLKNPKVSLLVHDWISSTKTEGVLNLLQSINQGELGQLSATLDGHVEKILSDPQDEFYQFLLKLHLSKNPDVKAFIEDDAAFILIKIVESKTSDSFNKVQSFK
ncbi:pyridoxal 5'-phosphate synthase [Martiniozyma asiatica (nom. inval.)]|nr:pyridoxal 5'-phosphate synthase [Martiniozyma asiatica]